MTPMDTRLFRINPKADARDVFHAVSLDPGGEPALIPVDEVLFRVADGHNEPEFSTVQHTIPEFISDGWLEQVNP